MLLETGRSPSDLSPSERRNKHERFGAATVIRERFFWASFQQHPLASSCLSGCFSKLLAVVVSSQMVARPGLMHPVSPRI
jgi:hypothetical protein